VRLDRGGRSRLPGGLIMSRHPSRTRARAHPCPIPSPVRFARRTLLGAGSLAVLAVAAACAPGTVTPGGQLAPPHIPDERGGLIVVESEIATVRPEGREVTEERLAQLQAPAGFRVAIFAEELENPRGIRVAPNGNVYVAERTAGRVRLLRDTDGDGRADVSRVVAEGLGEGLSGVHGLAIRENRLYMVTERELYSAPIQADGGLGERTLHLDDIPAGGQHPNRTMEFGPDGMLYLSIGSTCNACVEPIEEHATIVRVDPRTWEREVFAEGLRNTIGFGWHPVSGELFGLDHNTDERGNDWPPEKLNRIHEGRHYGWPFCGGQREPDWHVPADPEGMSREAFCAQTEPPVLTYTAHAAPMQMVYYTGGQFPERYRNQAFATMRGSWNRNPPAGYEVVQVLFDGLGNPIGIEPFVRGWLLEGGRAHFGRLMGIAQAADGSLIVGDDENGVVYRISYGGGS
jgi:glucose/arabinose dehydrogenase